MCAFVRINFISICALVCICAYAAFVHVCVYVHVRVCVCVCVSFPGSSLCLLQAGVGGSVSGVLDRKGKTRLHHSDWGMTEGQGGLYSAIAQSMDNVHI